jgi:hypothetical protein
MEINRLDRPLGLLLVLLVERWNHQLLVVFQYLYWRVPERPVFVILRFSDPDVRSQRFWCASVLSWCRWFQIFMISK